MTTLALIQAINNKKFPKIEELAKSDTALINAVDPKFEHTPFQHACRFGMKDAALLLFELGGDVDSRDDNDETPLQAVLSNGGGWISNLSQKQVDERTAVAIALLEKTKKLTPDLLLNACELGSGKARKLVEILLKRGAPLSGVAKNGATVLHRAVEHNHPSVVAAAVKTVPLDAKITSHPKGNTALHIACKKKLWPLAQQLVAAGARSDLANEKKETARSLTPKSMQSMFGAQVAAPAAAKSMKAKAKRAEAR